MVEIVDNLICKVVSAAGTVCPEMHAPRRSVRKTVISTAYPKMIDHWGT